MKIAFISNYFNHHQKHLSEAFNSLTNKNYAFIATGQISEERKKLGYGENEIPEYVKTIYENTEFTQNADTIIFGSAPDKLLKKYIKDKKLIFRYSERILKHGKEPLKYLPRLLRYRMRNPMNSNLYLLCASAYTAADYGSFGLFKNRAYKWGYFPKTEIYEDVNELISNKNTTDILWSGRFLKWKHPDDALSAAEKLKKDGYNFHLKFIGAGEMEETLRLKISEYNLTDCVSILGSMSPQEVRKYMEETGIYLFTSDFEEGWGAVLNEAMNSGCAVISSHAAGAAPYLIQNNENGYVYRSGNIEELYQKVKYLLDNHEEQKRIGRNAYKTIINEWNSEIAAQRLINLSEHIFKGEKYPDLYKSGPCSKSEILKNGWL